MCSPISTNSPLASSLCQPVRRERTGREHGTDHRIGECELFLDRAITGGNRVYAIAKDLGVARTTVDRMKPDMAQFNLFARKPSPPAERAPEDFNLRHARIG